MFCACYVLFCGGTARETHEKTSRAALTAVYSAAVKRHTVTQILFCNDSFSFFLFCFAFYFLLMLTTRPTGTGPDKQSDFPRTPFPLPTGRFQDHGSNSQPTCMHIRAHSSCDHEPGVCLDLQATEESDLSTSRKRQQKECHQRSFLYQGTLGSKQGKLSAAQSSPSAAGQIPGRGTNVERNPSGSFSHRTQRYCTWWFRRREVGRGGTNGDQRSVVYVMLARETRRPMNDLEGGRGRGEWGGLLGVIKRLLRL